MIVMISDDSRTETGLLLKELALSKELPLQYFSADRLDVQPCSACGSCSGQTYGRCVLQDDMQKVLPYVVGCRKLVLISPVIFGGPGFHIKKIIDRITAVGNPRYRVSGGELVKGMRVEKLNYYFVGSGDNLSREEEEAYLFLHKENIHIMSAKGQCFLVPATPNRKELEGVMEEIGDE